MSEPASEPAHRCTCGRAIRLVPVQGEAHPVAVDPEPLPWVALDALLVSKRTGTGRTVTRELHRKAADWQERGQATVYRLHRTTCEQRRRR